MAASLTAGAFESSWVWNSYAGPTDDYFRDISQRSYESKNLDFSSDEEGFWMGHCANPLKPGLEPHFLVTAENKVWISNQRIPSKAITWLKETPVQRKWSGEYARLAKDSQEVWRLRIYQDQKSELIFTRLDCQYSGGCIDSNQGKFRYDQTAKACFFYNYEFGKIESSEGLLKEISRYVYPYEKSILLKAVEQIELLSPKDDVPDARIHRIRLRLFALNLIKPLITVGPSSKLVEEVHGPRLATFLEKQNTLFGIETLQDFYPEPKSLLVLALQVLKTGVLAAEEFMPKNERPSKDTELGLKWAQAIAEASTKAKISPEVGTILNSFLPVVEKVESNIPSRALGRMLRNILNYLKEVQTIQEQLG